MRSANRVSAAIAGRSWKLIGEPGVAWTVTRMESAVPPAHTTVESGGANTPPVRWLSTYVAARATVGPKLSVGIGEHRRSGVAVDRSPAPTGADAGAPRPQTNG